MIQDFGRDYHAIPIWLRPFRLTGYSTPRECGSQGQRRSVIDCLNAAREMRLAMLLGFEKIFS